MGEGAGREGAPGARAAAAPLGGRRGGRTGGRLPPRRCTSGFVGASVFVRRTNGERTRRWALGRRKIHISSATALVPQRPPAHFPRRRSRAPRSAAASRPRPPRRRARRAPQRRASSSPGRRWTGAGARVTAAARPPAPRLAPRGRLSLCTGLHGCIGAGDSRMLGTVKMEGHESSDWNSYYADTQEVRAGQSGGPCRGRPGEAAGGLGTPPLGHRRPPTRGGPGPTLAGPRCRIHRPARGAGHGAGRWERARGFQGVLGFESTRPGSVFHFRVESPRRSRSRSRPGVPRAGGWALAGVGGHSDKAILCPPGRPLPPAVEFADVFR